MKITGISLFLLFVLLTFSILQKPTFASKKSYIVYFGGHSHSPSASAIDYERVTDTHYEFLGSYLGHKEKAKEAIFYSYTRHINGFAATLEEEEATAISKHPKVISTFLNRGRKLHTTRSWNFLGLERGDGVIPAKSIWRQARFGEDIIIGNLDTGVWPESESFNDDGMGPIPSKWKGFCQNDTIDGVRCNRKLIGGRFFNKGYQAMGGIINATTSTARDTEGHGTHTLSTAGGRFVPNANIYSYANGTAKGGSPNARVAAYKVCWIPINGSECSDADIIAGFDMAIHDGVDVLSVSLGGDPGDYFKDGVAIGSFHAVKNGIPVVCSAGNSGPTPGTVTNTAPWILTVGASSMDREFPAFARLGNNMQYMGQSLSNTFLAEKFYPLISSIDAAAPNATTHDAQLCYVGSLDPEKVRGKIVACLRGINARVEKGEAVLLAGGAGMILANDQINGYEILADAHVLPATHISAVDGVAVFAYINSTREPMAYITAPTTNVPTKPAPLMAAFSSQGPNTVIPEILKPDITAPGLSVLAAFTNASSPTDLDFDSRRVLFNIISGTSMSCPHVAGIVGLIKAIHPEWTPAAIRSSIMTTSRSRDNTREPIDNSTFIRATPFSYGAGHVWPNRAMDPGLVYDLTNDDYLHFFCALGYNSTQVAKFTADYYSCAPTNKSTILDFNYPSITVPNLIASTTIRRTVKNVGSPGMYKATIHAPRGVSVSVEPSSLNFVNIGEEKTFTVTLVPKARLGPDYVFGKLVWSDGLHHVRSPISVSATGL